jgi:hypothetical protein
MLRRKVYLTQSLLQMHSLAPHFPILTFTFTPFSSHILLNKTAEATEHRLEVVTRQLAAADGTSAELGALEAATSSDLKDAQAQHASV